MIFRCYIIEYFAKDKLLSNLLKDECDTPFEMYSDVCFYLNEIFKSGIRGVTILPLDRSINT